MENFGIWADTDVMTKTPDRQTIVETLRRHRARLEAAGVDHLALFGSIARDEAGADSDIDIVARYDRSVVRDLLDLGAVAAVIATALGTDDFDLADEDRLKAPVRADFERDHVRVF